MSGFFYWLKLKGKNLISIISIFVFSLIFLLNPIIINKNCAFAKAEGFPNIHNIIRQIFSKEENIEKKDSVFVYLGGYPLGFTIDCSGVVVISISNQNIKNIKEGDIITKIENTKINNVADVSKIINDENNINKELNVSIVRNENEEIASITPVYDFISGKYKLGLWVRDNAAGVGTLTYVRKDSLRFGALGHPVCDIDTGCVMPTLSGNIFKCHIVDVKKGQSGAAGELKGLFLRNGSILGEIDKNNNFGVYGNFEKEKLDMLDQNLYEVASKDEIKSGKATIRCTLDGSEPQEYEIEIVKKYFQTEKNNKSMFIRVTDKNLINLTGGIVQGMSGSPIIQNGKLVGAVTHVFVSDPTKGYGVYADLMIDN